MSRGLRLDARTLVDGVVPAGAVADAAGRFAAVVRTAGARARAAARPVLAWMALSALPVDPLDLAAWAMSRSVEPVLWTRPAEGFAFVGLGRAWTCDAAGATRFEAARDAWDDLRHHAVTEATDSDAASPDGAWSVAPVLAGGFAFNSDDPVQPPWSEFGASSLVLPRLGVVTRGGLSRVIISAVVQPDQSDDDGQRVAGEVTVWLSDLSRRRVLTGARPDPASDGGTARALITTHEPVPAAEWKVLVARAARAVQDRELLKVVLARSLRVASAAFDPLETLRRLREGFPTCAIFAVARGKRWFVGATPERLVRVRAGEVSAMALAGSAPRGRTDADDRRLGEALVASAKDRVEHAVVVDTLRASLSDVCEAISVAGAPSLLRFSNVQHLHTPIAARLRQGYTVLDLVGRLHPTPAVGGVPRATALEWLRQNERLDRGWYAGPLGWVDARGDGEFAVAIRSALVGPDEALLYAGCGIVADSDPDAEYAESQLKLRTMLSALGAGDEA
ncbi:MAG: isochorismate synthase [Armatimonadota bacterium]|nr:isochorismate synthase [Armatimonadota bacterium]